MGRRVIAVAVGLVVLGAACSFGSGEDSGNAGAESGGAAAAARSGATLAELGVASVASTGAEDVPSALSGDRHDDAFPDPLLNPDLINSGGPPPDGIPPIDDPRFLAVEDVDFLAGDEPVLAVSVDGDARAYPLQIMTWHELVNDTIGGIPITVSYCPLCNSGVAYDRRLGDRILDFGTSGSLYESSMVMYDRQTETLWTHFDGTAVVGWLAGETVDFVPSQTLSWSTFSEAYPEGLVLSRDTGFDRRYGDNPYEGYEGQTEPYSGFFSGDADPRLGAKERVLGIRGSDDSVAIGLETLAGEGTLSFTAPNSIETPTGELTAWHLPGTSSALDGESVSGGTDVGATGVFVPVAADGTALTFSRDGGMFVDAETGSIWDITGMAVSGSLAGEQLRPVEHLDTFWFAWATFQPETTLIGV